MEKYDIYLLTGINYKFLKNYVVKNDISFNLKNII